MQETIQPKPCGPIFAVAAEVVITGLVQVTPCHDGESHAFDDARKVTRRASLDRERPMRMLLRGAVALVILLVAYWAWALAGAAQLASAAERGDANAVIERVDLQALIRSLSGQIARAFLDQNPQLQNPPPPRQGVFLNASAAEMLLRALLTPDNIAALLSQGRVRRRRRR
jgi:Protein of unknown function (DUF2939)